MAKEHFNAKSQINKYKLDESTFDLVDIQGFHNTKASTIFAYFLMWIIVLLSWVLLGADIYTCLNILVFHRWSSNDYKPYAYSIAKWIFTGCIIFEFLLLLYHWIWAIHTYKTKNIALVYVNNIARLLYSIKSYNYFCLFNQIQQDNFFDWSTFFCYGEIDNALQILVADTPRQVINILTLRYYATDGESNNNILENIKSIATTNLTLSIILSLMCVSVVIWCIFFFKFAFGMILYLPVAFKVKSRTANSSLKKYCCSLVNANVRLLVLKHHKSKRELLDKGILDKHDIITNPLLNNSSTDLENLFVPPPPPSQKLNSKSSTSILKPPPVTTSTYELSNMRKDSFTDPFNDSSSTIFDQQRKRPPPVFQNAYNNNSQSSLTTLNNNNNNTSNALPPRKPPKPLDVTNMSSRYMPPRNASVPTNQYQYNQSQPQQQPLQTRKLSADSLNTTKQTNFPPRRLVHTQTEPNLYSQANNIPSNHYQPLQTSHTLQSLDAAYQPQSHNPFMSTSHSYNSNEFNFNTHDQSQSPPSRESLLSSESSLSKENDDEFNDSNSKSSLTHQPSAAPYPLQEINDEEDEDSNTPYPARGVSIYDYYNYDQVKSQYDK
ncbi:hypothetical protein DFJ63DRAFT_333351 [Scheffersomyces coipomensis]|uniref:uncharacterized protein n=1 Tax=Scheffersomyces coipomensis TaxID=1788519 RepID=UPI00315D2866